MNQNFDLFEIEINDILIFIRDLKINKVPIYRLKKIDKYTYQFYTNTLDRYKMRKIGLIPIKSIGVFHYISLMFKSFLNIVGLISFVFSVYLFSNMIFQVEVIGSNPAVNEMILNVLHDEGVHQFNFLYEYQDLNVIYNKVQENFKQDIDYLNVYQIGSVFFVEYTNSIGATPQDLDFNNLYASKNGVIKQVDVKSGNILISENMYVTKGQLLVSNTLVSTSDEIIMIPVEGSVYAYTYETFEATVDDISDDGDAFSYLLFCVRNQISGIDKIDVEQIISYTSEKGKKSLVVRYIFIEQIGVKEEIFDSDYN